MKLLHSINVDAITPAMELLPRRMDSFQARHQMLTIGLQESRLQYRKQIPNGPAHGLWQFEKGGVRGVLTHASTRLHARALCEKLEVEPTVPAVYDSLRFDDVLAAGFARLNLWWHAEPLPPLGAKDDAWNYYLFCWRPGKPHPHTWERYYDQVTEYMLCHEY